MLHLRRLTGRRAALLGLAAAGVALLGLGLGRVQPHRVLSALVGVRPGWLGLAGALMALALLLRGLSWLAVLRAALPRAHVPAGAVLRATMIGVMASAGLPGRLGEPVRAVVVARHLGRLRDSVAVVAGTIVSQTLLNLVALIGLGAAVIAFAGLVSAPVAIAGALAAPVAVVVVMLAAPSALARAGGAGAGWLPHLAGGLGRELGRARAGLRVFIQVREGIAATAAQLAAWGVQVLACYAVLRALGLDHIAGLLAAAALLVAVNLTAVVPVTPANVGVFQAACAAILAGFGVAGGRGVAYGIVLQAVEVLTAIALGLPALAQEGLSWAQLRRATTVAE